MFSAANLPTILPLFPLSGVLMLPRARLPLQVFEPRYLAMLDDVLRSSHRLIGLVQPLNPDGEPLHSIGCAGRVTSFTETDDGRYMITLTGICRFQITEEQAGFSPYRKADIDWGRFQGDLGRPEQDAGFDRAGFLPTLRRYLEAGDMTTDWDRLKDTKDELLINSLSMMCPLSPEDKQALLECATLRDRRKTLVTLIEYALLSGSEDEVMQ